MTAKIIYFQFYEEQLTHRLWVMYVWSSYFNFLLKCSHKLNLEAEAFPVFTRIGAGGSLQHIQINKRKSFRHALNAVSRSENDPIRVEGNIL